MFVSNEYCYILFLVLMLVFVGMVVIMLFCNVIFDIKSEDFVEKIDGFIE